jgi:co-chaperonin GroES (HSP10)
MKKVTPLGRKILLSIPETKTGSLIVQQGAQIQEIGTVLDISKKVLDDLEYYGIDIGDTIHFKAWGVDIICIDQDKYYYLDVDSDALCGVVKSEKKTHTK